MAWHGRDWKGTCIALGARDYRNDTKSLVLIFRFVKYALCMAVSFYCRVIEVAGQDWREL